VPHCGFAGLGHQDRSSREPREEVGTERATGVAKDKFPDFTISL
jgi:hypothetical protein